MSSKTNVYNQVSKEGFTLLITLLLLGLLLAISGTLMHVTLKQFQLSGIALASEIAFHAANSGLECAQYLDLYEDTPNVPKDIFGIDKAERPSGGNQSEIACMGVSNPTVSYTYPGSDPRATLIDSSEVQEFQYSWGGTWNSAQNRWDGTANRCTKIQVIKYRSMSSSVSLGADANNRSCPQGITCTVIKSRGYNNSCANITRPQTVERELVLVY